MYEANRTKNAVKHQRLHEEVGKAVEIVGNTWKGMGQTALLFEQSYKGQSQLKIAISTLSSIALPAWWLQEESGGICWLHLFEVCLSSRIWTSWSGLEALGSTFASVTIIWTFSVPCQGNSLSFLGSSRNFFSNILVVIHRRSTQINLIWWESVSPSW